jgi:hypothetical protein
VSSLHRKVVERARLLAEDDSTDLTNPRRRKRRRETAKVGFPRRRPLLVIERTRRIADGPLSPLGHR